MTDQDPSLPLDALKAAGCVKVFVDKASGALDRDPRSIGCSTSRKTDYRHLAKKP